MATATALFRYAAATATLTVPTVIIESVLTGAGKSYRYLAASTLTNALLIGSLTNVLKELQRDVGVPMTNDTGNLWPWADQGVLLLNSVLTTRAHEPTSHAGRGWEKLTDAAIAALSAKRSGLVFMLWGSHAKRKAALIDRACRQGARGSARCCEARPLCEELWAACRHWQHGARPKRRRSYAFTGLKVDEGSERCRVLPGMRSLGALLHDDLQTVECEAQAIGFALPAQGSNRSAYAH